MQPMEDVDDEGGNGQYEDNYDENDDENYDENDDDIPAAHNSDTGSSSASTSDDQYDQEDEDDQDDELGQDEEETPQAPSFKIPSRTIAAVEHPFLVMDLTKGLETFGPNPQYRSVSPEAHLI